jgi:hypothetical protein
MIDLTGYLDSYRKEIVDSVNGKYTPDIMKDKTFETLVKQLMASLSLGHNNQPSRDKVHEELARTIMHSMYCGWVSQAKKNRGAYTQQYVDSFKQGIAKAFETGQKYAEEKP